MSEATVGEILGYLRLDASDWNRELDQAGRKSDELGRKSPNIKIGTNAAETITKLEAVAVATRKLQDAQGRASVAQVKLIDLQRKGNASATQLKSAEEALARSQRAVTTAANGVSLAQMKASASGDKLDESNKKVDKSGKATALSMRAMATAIVTLGPALVPLSAAAVGLGGALGGMGAAGILAVVGIKKEMAAGTATGAKYTQQIDILKGNLDTLSHTAAAGVLSAFQEDVANLQTQMPFLNGMVGNFSTMLGRTSTNLLTGVISSLHVLEPLLMQAGVYIDGLSSKFASAAGGAGMQSFTDYARSVLPQVTAALESITGAVVHLVASFSGLGLGTVGMLKMLSDVINAIPLDVLSTLASAASSVFLAFRTWQGLSSLVGSLTTKLELAAGATRALSIAAGGISAILAVATFAYQAHAQKVAQDQQAVNELTDALIRNGGVVGDNTIKDQAAALAKNGTLAAAKSLGYAMDDVTLASLGNAEATARVNAHTKDLKASYDEATSAGGAASAGAGDVGAAFDKVAAATGNGTKNLGLAEQAYRAYKAATDSGTGSSDAQTAALQRQASQMGTTVGALLAAETGQKKTRDAAAQATLQMQLENDAAGLLKQSLDLLNGKSLSLAQAQTTSASATLSTVEALKKNKSALNLNTAAGVADRQALEQKASADQMAAEAVAKATKSTKAGTAAYGASKSALEGALRSQGLLTGKVQAYIDKLYDVKNLKVPPTKLDVVNVGKAKMAAAQAASDKVARARMIYIGAGNTKAMPVIKSTQSASDKVAKARLIYLAANNSGAVGVLRNTQSASDRVAKSRLIYLAANGSQAIGVIRSVQGAVDGLHGKTITIVTRHVAGTDAGDVVGHGSRHANGGTIEGHAFGGTVGGNGGPRADDQPFMGPRGLVMLSSGEEVIKNGPAQKYRPLLKAINSGKFASGGTIGAAGPAPDMQEIMALFSAGLVTAADVRAAQGKVGTAKKSVTTATTALHNARVSSGAAGRRVSDARYAVRHAGSASARHAAESRLTSALENQRKVNGQVAAAEDKLAAARKGVTKATKDANAAAARYKAPVIDQFKSATKTSNKLSASFLANLTTLASRGFTTLARSLLEDGSSQAQTIAAQAVKSTAKAKGLEADLKASAKTEAGLNALDDKLNGVNQPPAQLKPVTLKPGESLTIGGQVIKGSPTKVMPSPQAGGGGAYGQPAQTQLSPDAIRQLVQAISNRPVAIDGRSLASPMNTELVRGMR